MIAVDVEVMGRSLVKVREAEGPLAKVVLPWWIVGPFDVVSSEDAWCSAPFGLANTLVAREGEERLSRRG